MYNIKHTLLYKSGIEMATIIKTSQYLTELYYCTVIVNTLTSKSSALTYTLMDSTCIR